jgi:hypothetical protein
MGKAGIGMPAALLLDEFGSLVQDAFGGAGYGVYQVGSSLRTTAWRDVDVRLILSDEEYAALGLGDPEHPHQNARWVALVRAFCALGREITGLPIDFQIQQQTHANAKHAGTRSALGVLTYFRRNPEPVRPTAEPVREAAQP